MRFRTGLAMLALLLWGGVSLQAGYTYVFQGTDGAVVEFDRDVLYHNYAAFPIGSSDLEYCRFSGAECGSGIFVAVSRPDATFGTHDLVSFGATNADMARLPGLALTRTGSAGTLHGSAIEGRLTVYERNPDFLFEYYFKDSTGERTFRYYTDRLISHERKMADGSSDLCGPGLPQGCEDGDFVANIYQLDALRFPGLLPYYFPQYALTTLGTHYTDSLSPESGVLTVRSVRNPFGGEVPGEPDPGDLGGEPVPEPSTLWLSAMGALGIGWRLYGRRGAKRSASPAREPGEGLSE